ncbi:sialidase-3-like [Rhinoraja longicauda]
MAAASLSSALTLFESVQPGPVYRIPSLLYLNSQQVFLAFAEKRTSSSDVDAKVLVLRRGKNQDGAVKWDEVVELSTAVKSGYRSMNPCPVYERVKQVVYLFFNCVEKGVSEHSQWYWGRNAARLCYVASRDAGLTWGQVSDLTESVIGERARHWGTFSVSPGHGIQRECGTLVVPAYAYIARHRCYPIPPGCFTKPRTFYLYSEDGGEHWRVGEPVSRCGTLESEVAEIAVPYGNRVLYCNARTDARPWSCWRRPARVEAVSLESGLFEIVRLARQLPESDHGCQGSVVSFSCPASKQLSWLLYTHPLGSSKSNCCRNRTNLAVYLNRCPLRQRRWEGPWVIQPGPSGYSDLVYLDQASTFACLHECGDRQPYERIIFRLFSIDDVLRNIEQPGRAEATS